MTDPDEIIEQWAEETMDGFREWAESEDAPEVIEQDVEKTLSSAVRTPMDQFRGRDVDYETLDRTLYDAFKQQVWPEDIEKADPVWSDDDDVPDDVRQWVEDVAEHMDPMYHVYEDIPQAAALTVHEDIVESLTQPQGWSINSIVERITDDFEWLDKNQAITIARMEVAAVLNESREVAMRARTGPDGEPEVRWHGPEDADTTELCSTAKERIASEHGGSVTFDELHEILFELAVEYQDEGGTPERVQQLVPHFSCRHAPEEA